MKVLCTKVDAQSDGATTEAGSGNCEREERCVSGDNFCSHYKGNVSGVSGVNVWREMYEYVLPTLRTTSFSFTAFLVPHTC